MKAIGIDLGGTIIKAGGIDGCFITYHGWEVFDKDKIVKNL